MPYTINTSGGCNQRVSTVDALGASLDYPHLDVSMFNARWGILVRKRGRILGGSYSLVFDILEGEMLWGEDIPYYYYSGTSFLVVQEIQMFPSPKIRADANGGTTKIVGF